MLRNPQIDLSDGLGGIWEQNSFNESGLTLFHPEDVGRKPGIFDKNVAKLLPYL